MNEITVNASVSYVYDTDDGIVTNEAEAIEDVESMILNSEITLSQFTITVGAEPQNVYHLTRDDLDAHAGRPVTDGEYRNVVKSLERNELLAEIISETLTYVLDADDEAEKCKICGDTRESMTACTDSWHTEHEDTKES